MPEGATNKVTVVQETTTETKKHLTVQEILRKAGKRALGGGLTGAAAMVLQVGSLMWLRTTMNYQYRHGTSTMTALRTLYSQGGVARFYRGVGPALIQGPMSRFGDTAANAGVLALLDESESTRDLSIFAKTSLASLAAASWRIALMPIDTLKTTLQVEGAQGMALLRSKIATGGPTVLFHGAMGAFAATYAGHYPWFATYNALKESLPSFGDSLAADLSRAAVIGFAASCVSDTVSNSLRVLKTYRQTSEVKISYMAAARKVIAADGVAGLFGRGLRTRIIANGLQGSMFSLGWKYFTIQWEKAAQEPKDKRA